MSEEMLRRQGLEFRVKGIRPASTAAYGPELLSDEPWLPDRLRIPGPPAGGQGVRDLIQCVLPTIVAEVRLVRQAPIGALPIDALQALLLELEPALRASPQKREVLAEALDERERSGQLRLPAQRQLYEPTREI
jgi:hypothetical protein